MTRSLRNFRFYEYLLYNTVEFCKFHSSSQEEGVRTGENAGDSQEELHTVRGPTG